ncbi:MAG: zinc-ribbon protein [Bacteroidetes bacterium]|nr:zinc-ribbon protein [Bacteroidota bacterium]
MIIYGWREKQTATQEITDPCNNCGKPFSMSLHVFHRYFHVFWIPLFPIGKTVKSHCSACGITNEKRDLPEAVRLSYKNMPRKNRIPVWMFAGPIIIAGCVSVGFIKDEFNKKEYANMIQQPLKGDIYKVKTDDGNYTLYKVQSTSADTVNILLNEYQSDNAKDIDQLKSMGYNDTALAVLRSDLQDMLQKGDIIGVDRN